MCEEVSEENMIQCMSCRRWVHENCAWVKKVKKGFSVSAAKKVI
jgi:hypothetical protein